MSEPSDADEEELDGCDLDFRQFAVDAETAELLPLFPDSVVDETVAAEWRALGVAIANGEIEVP